MGEEPTTDTGTGAAMEHPLSIDEFFPSPALQSETVEAPAAVALPSAIPAVALPPLPNLAESDALLLQPSDPRYAGFLPATNKLTQLSPALRAVCNTERRCRDGRLGSQQ